MGVDSQKQNQSGTATVDAVVGTSSTPGKGTLTGGALPRTTHDLAPPAPGFLSSTARANLVQQVTGNIGQACSNFNLAVTEVNFAQLMEKSSDMPWVLSLLLDVVGGHLATQLGDTLKALKKSESEILVKLGGELGESESWRMKAYSSIVSMSDATLGLYVKSSFSTAQKNVVSAAQKLGGPLPSEKAETSTFLDQLRNNTDVSFERLRSHVPEATDAELVSMLDAFSVRNNFVDAYREALKAKMARYKASGVSQIRRSTGGTPFEAPDDAPGNGRGFHDTGGYLVWRNYVSGRKELIFQRQGMSDPSKLADPRHGGEDGIFVPKDDTDFTPDKLVVVPTEFQAAALAKHVEVWHSSPGTEPEPYDDSGYYWDPERAAAAKRKKSIAAIPAGRPDAPVVIPDALRLKP